MGYVTQRWWNSFILGGEKLIHEILATFNNLFWIGSPFVGLNMIIFEELQMETFKRHQIQVFNLQPSTCPAGSYL